MKVLRKTLLLLLWMMGTLAVSFLPAYSQQVPKRPVTKIFNGSTAYTLQPGEIEAGDFWVVISIPYFGFHFDIEQIRWVSLEIGIIDRLQVGTTLLENFLQGPNLFGKYLLLATPTTVQPRVAVALPYSLDINIIGDFSIGGSSGLILSYRVFPSLGIHSGFGFWLSTGLGFMITRLYLGADWGLSSWIKGLAEFDYWPQVKGGGLSPFDLGIGLLFQASPLELRVLVDMPFQGLFFFLQGELTFRF